MSYRDNSFVICTDDKAKEFGKAVIKAVEKTHTIANKCRKITEELDIAKNKKDKDFMVQTLQKYIRQYRSELENRKMVKICLLRRDEYDVLKDEYWIEQLNMMKSFIYFYEVQKSIEKETIKGCLKKLLIKSGNFTKSEVEKLFL